MDIPSQSCSSVSMTAYSAMALRGKLADRVGRWPRPHEGGLRICTVLLLTRASRKQSKAKGEERSRGSCISTGLFIMSFGDP